MNSVLRKPWQQKYDTEYARKVDSVINTLDHCRSISKISKQEESIRHPQMLTKRDFKILCKEIGRALEYYSGGEATSIYSLKCNGPKEDDGKEEN
jgi:hypothetical protein